MHSASPEGTAASDREVTRDAPCLPGDAATRPHSIPFRGQRQRPAEGWDSPCIAGLPAYRELWSQPDDDRGGRYAPNRAAGRPSNPPAATPPSGAASAIAAAVAAYRSYWDDAVYANARAGYWNDTTRASLGTGGSLYTLFAQHAAGSAFEQQRVAVYRADRNGEFTEGDLKLHPLVLDASPTTRPTEVRLTDCVDATDWLVHVRSDGKLKNGRPGRKYQFEAKVLHNVSGWHVSDASTPPNATC